MKDLIVEVRSTSTQKLDFLSDGHFYEFRLITIEENGDTRSKAIRLSFDEMAKVLAHFR